MSRWRRGGSQFVTLSERFTGGVILVQTITATFEDGMLKPTQPLDLPAHAEVRLTIELLPVSPLTIGKLNAFLRSLPALGDDAEEYAQDVRAVRAEFPAEANPWD
jgi:predicted DNA-binding antitoxin AbrB/MazE fold protein